MSRATLKKAAPFTLNAMTQHSNYKIKICGDNLAVEMHRCRKKSEVFVGEKSKGKVDSAGVRLICGLF